MHIFQEPNHDPIHPPTFPVPSHRGLPAGPGGGTFRSADPDQKVIELLRHDISLKEVPDKGLTLKGVLELTARYATKLNGGKEVRFVIDLPSFRRENEDLTLEAILGEEITLPAMPRTVSLATLLRTALGHLPSKNATYLLRPSIINDAQAGQP